MVVGGSLSKTAANDAKAKSQFSGVVNTIIVVLTLLFLAPFFEKLPEATGQPS